MKSAGDSHHYVEAMGDTLEKSVQDVIAELYSSVQKREAKVEDAARVGAKAIQHGNSMIYKMTRTIEAEQVRVIERDRVKVVS